MENSKEFLRIQYIDKIGYDPFKDDPQATVESVEQTLREYDIDLIESRKPSEHERFFTVIVWVPDSLFYENGERSTRIQIVKAKSPKEAIENARTDSLVSLIDHDELDDWEEENNFSEFEALYCFEGKLNNLA